MGVQLSEHPAAVGSEKCSSVITTAAKYDSFLLEVSGEGIGPGMVQEETTFPC